VAFLMEHTMDDESQTLTPDAIRALVRPGRVHRRAYADPELFELEQERIFSRFGSTSRMKVS